MSLLSRPQFRLISFGTWRFFLAFLVVISHLWSGMVDGPAAYAVWGFFVLSGYLMTYVLNNKYGFAPKGLLAYIQNRFLRIMPAYWVALMIGIITIFILSREGINLQLLNPQFAMPPENEWLFSFTLMPFFHNSTFPVPVANALAIEWLVYFLIPLMARHVSAAWIGALLGLFVNYHYGITPSSFTDRYSEFLPCFLPFAVGALVAHYIRHLRALSAPKLSFFVWIVHGLVWYIRDSWPWTYGLYASILLSAWVIVSMDCDKSSKTDKLLGDLSYPIYLLHTTVGGWFLTVYGYDRSFMFFAVSFAATISVSYLMIIFVDKPVLKRKRQPTIQIQNEKSVQVTETASS
ncbi:acyltransferase [Cohnella lubricantis]|uniref:Acyltransferase n=1 Tax=Cohnella lubricantis TaxID=2163172 RepID=A0A841TIL9_9BACL|nr:acyltransferase [Cohnella lubricantis]MBB6678777.1 acyltransferase [Cohnella lubricantis]MBP2117861.1 peptidoglycan/LPS O-acetylase OafA/YrhL [Cohnella lubricantis]